MAYFVRVAFAAFVIGLVAYKSLNLVERSSIEVAPRQRSVFCRGDDCPTAPTTSVEPQDASSFAKHALDVAMSESAPKPRIGAQSLMSMTATKRRLSPALPSPVPVLPSSTCELL